MSLFDDYFTPEALTTTRARIVGWFKAAGGLVTAFIKGSVPEQILEAMTQSANASAALASQQIRGRASLDTATDPGDYDPYDATNAQAAPGPGFLSEKGAGDFGTPRLDETFANGTVILTNGSANAITFAPEQLSFARTTVDPVTGVAPTYRNTDGGPTYTRPSNAGTIAANPDGTLTVAAGLDVYLPIVCEQKGVMGNASASQITLVTVLGTGVTATNDATVLASGREAADPYRARCRAAPALLSPNGPGDAYRTVATRAFRTDAGEVLFIPPFGDGVTGIGVDADGNPVQVPNARGTSLGITRVYVSKDSSTGIVAIYCAGSGGGAAISGSISDLTSLLNAVYWPDGVTRSIGAATDVTIDISGTIYAKPGAGVSSGTILAAANAELEADFPLYDIGGFNQTAGAGTIYKQELESTVNGSDKSIYRVVLTLPSGNTSLALGEVAVLGSTAGLSVVIA